MPKSKEQSDMIKSMILNQKRGIAFWIGLRKNRDYHERKDPLNYNKWTWNDGAFLTSKSWKDWDNHRPHKQNCVMLTRSRRFSR